MNEWEYNILDHRWNNFKRWANAMIARKDKPVMLVSSLKDMISYIDTTSDMIDDKIIEALCEKTPPSLLPTERKGKG